MHFKSLLLSFLVIDLTVCTNRSIEDVPHMRLLKDIFHRDSYDVRVRPIQNPKQTLKVRISMSLYQLIEVDEPSQNIVLNMWMIQQWTDEFLHWDPPKYGMINSTNLPYETLWIPDTYLYNSVKMARDETERYMNIQATSRYWQGKNGSEMSFLYPAIYTLTCRLNVRFFPYDRQNCTLTISSWTNSKSTLDYYADLEVNMASFIPNEEWEVKSFKVFRHELKYTCCPDPWVVLQASLVIQRRPLYYIVNLIGPTAVITIVAMIGFFSDSSTEEDRKEKVNLGINTLLAMSILMLMISDAMPTTSEFVPLMAWFFLAIIVIVSIGTFLTSIVLSIQDGFLSYLFCRRRYGCLPPLFIRYLFLVVLPKLMWVAVPPPLEQVWAELDDDPYNTWKNRKERKKKLEVAPFNKENITPLSPLPSTRTALAVPGAANRAALTVMNNLDKTTAHSDDQSSNPPSPSLSRALSVRSTMWDGAVGALVRTNSSVLRRTSSTMPKELDVMKRKRQCSLEWEYLATVLDRLLLIIFIGAVFLVTAGLITIGLMAQYSYDHPEEGFF